MIEQYVLWNLAAMSAEKLRNFNEMNFFGASKFKNAKSMPIGVTA